MRRRYSTSGEEPGWATCATLCELTAFFRPAPLVRDTMPILPNTKNQLIGARRSRSRALFPDKEAARVACPRHIRHSRNGRPSQFGAIDYRASRARLILASGNLL